MITKRLNKIKQKIIIKMEYNITNWLKENKYKIGIGATMLVTSLFSHYKCNNKLEILTEINP